MLLAHPNSGSAATVALVASKKQIFVDPATEFKVTRWTEESAVAALPGDLHRAITQNDKHLVYASNRSGHWQPYLLSLPAGESVQIAEASDLKPSTLALWQDDKEVMFVDGDRLVRSQLRRPRLREVYQSREGWVPTGALRVSSDDRSVALMEGKADALRITLVNIASGKGRTIIESAEGKLHLLDFHPRFGAMLLDSRHHPVFLGGAASPALPPFAEGVVLDARFDHTGNRLLYLLRTAKPLERTQLMEIALPGGKHHLIANTSKFAAFSANADTSVFVGASDSLAQPLLLLLLRVTRREFSLMEHSASQPAIVRPFFSHDSQNIFFQSDRLGKTCIFSVSVKGLVERT